MIKWNAELDEGLREYRATVSGIEFHIIHALDGSRHSFGLTAYRRDENGRCGLNLANQGHGIAWLRTLRRCKERAETIVSREVAL